MTAAAEKQKPQEIVVAPPTAPAATTPMDLLNQAVGNGNIELAEKLMGLQERWEKNQARKSFDAAIASAKADIKPIARTGKAHNNKAYATFADIAKVVDPILSKNGLSYRFRTSQADRINVTCVLSHRDGHSEETTLAGPPDKTGSKNDIQAIGSTLTYLQRYSLVQMLGLAAAADDDGKAGGAGECITQQQADDLRDLLEVNGKDVAKFLKWAKVEKLEEIPAANLEACIAAANYKKA